MSHVKALQQNIDRVPACNILILHAIKYGNSKTVILILQICVFILLPMNFLIMTANSQRLVEHDPMYDLMHIYAIAVNCQHEQDVAELPSLTHRG